MRRKWGQRTISRVKVLIMLQRIIGKWFSDPGLFRSLRLRHPAEYRIMKAETKSQHREIIVPLMPSLFVTISFTIALSSALLASELPDLPTAFDAGWEGKKTCEILYETESVRVARCSFAPGTGHEKHFHYPHFGWVLESGTMRITGENGAVQDRETTAGGSWTSSEITVHEVLNIGDTTTSYLIVEPKTRVSQAVDN